MGAVEVPEDRYWGAQTQRSLEHFDIGRDTFVWGRAVVRGLGLLKKSAALANADLGLLDGEVARAVVKAADEVARGDLDDHFPLVVFQTGSGTQSNMNANEVIANRAIQLWAASSGASPPCTRTTTSTAASRATTPSPRPCTSRWSSSWSSGSHPAVDGLAPRSKTRPASSATSSRSAGPTSRTRRR